MGAPIPYTCPDIDAVIEHIKEQATELRLLQKKIDKTPYEKYEDLMGEVSSSIAGVESELGTYFEKSWGSSSNPLEKLRSSNDTLRSYGEDMEEQRDQLDDQISTLEAETERLEDKVKDLEKDLVELQNELDNESNQRLALEDEVEELKGKLLMYLKV